MTYSNLRNYRTKLKMSQRKLAKASGVSQTIISFIENGLSEPMELTKQKLSIALKVPVGILFPSKMGMHDLRVCRVQQSMTQKKLAKVSGVSQVTISFIETGIITNPTDATKEKLSRALKVPVKQLFPA